MDRIQLTENNEPIHRCSPIVDGPTVEEADVCAICLEPPRVPYKLVNCVHKFCKSCLLQVREQTKNDPRCSLCRQLSFLAVSLVPGVESLDLGHPSTERMQELKIDPAEITAAMVCVTCHLRRDPASLVQCDACHALWHGTCLVEPILETRDENGLPFKWTCSGCTARLRADNTEVRESMKAFFAKRAREARSRFQSDDPFASENKRAEAASGGGGGGGAASAPRKYKKPARPAKKLRISKNEGEENDVRFSGRELGKGQAGAPRSFFGRAAPIPRSPESATRSPHADADLVDPDDDFDSEF